MKSRMILILALIMALITTFFFSRYLKGLDAKYKSKDNKISIVVAKEPIAKNQRVTKEMLETRDLSADSVHPEAVRKMEDIIGDYALVDMKKGEILFASRFTNQFKETELVTRKIQEGSRAVSIEVNYVESVSNLIEPEDHVDVVFSQKTGTSGSSPSVATQVLLQNVRVLAVGDRITPEDEKSTSGKTETKSTDTTASTTATTSGNQTKYVSVTLELKPEDAVKIINCDEKGDLKLILRSTVEK